MDSALHIKPDSARVEKAVTSERRKLLEFIRRRVGNDADAEDILQDVFTKLVASSAIGEPIEQLSAWLFRVARNRIIDWYRRKKPESLPDESPDVPRSGIAEILLDPGQNPDDVFTRSLLWEEFAEALDDLPENQREVFVMHEFEGLGFREIAERTGERINTLISRKRYAVLYLRERLQELYDELFD